VSDYRRDTWISALVLAAILIVVFSPFLLGHKSLLASAGDVPSLYLEGAVPGHPTGHYRGLDQGASGWQTEPAFAAAHHVMFEEHRLPFWDADGAYGKPSLGAMVPQEFYPLTTLVDMHPTPRMYSWWIVTRLFIAGFSAALFVRLFFASRWAAISAGISAMFTGYFLLYYDMPHLSVEVEIPMLLWATEIVSRRPSARRIAALAVAVALVVLGGMPESALLALSLSALYAILRLATLPGERRKRVLALAGAYVLGAAVGSIELVPFLELLVRGASDHDPSVRQGLGFDGAWHNGLLTELFPRAFGNPFESILQNGPGFSGTRGFFGITGLLLGSVAIASAWLKRDKRTAIVTFFAIVATYLVLKRFGNPLVNWTGALPFFVQVQFQKYGEAELGCIAAILVGFGVGYLRERRGDSRALWIAFGATISLATIVYLNTRQLIAPTFAMNLYPHSIAFGLDFLLVAAGAAAFITWKHDRLRFLGSAIILAVLVAEPFVTYLYPVLFRGAPPIDQNPFAGAPYISYLQERMDRTHERLFGIDGMLFPNWASAYHLADTRSLEAVTLRNYLPFVDAFVATTPADSDDQFDRFVATKPISMNLPLVRRWLTLSSVGYVLSPAVNSLLSSPPGSILDRIMTQADQQITPAERPAVRKQPIDIGGIAEATLFEHPPHDITFRTTVVKSNPRLVADLALSPGSYQPVIICGGPVTFTLRALQDGKLVAMATRTIDPKHVIADRRWIPFSLDLAKSAGHVVDVHFQTSAVDTCAAWALWGEPRFIPASAPMAIKQPGLVFPLVYRATGVNIFRVPNSLPRLVLYHQVKSVTSFAEAISALTSPAFDVYHQAVVEGTLPAVSPSAGNDHVTITSMRSDRIEASIVADSPGLLMQNDAWYPGWKATVDGRDVPIVRTDGFFRGIPLAAGQHSVTIAYQSVTALAGMLLSLIGLIVLVVLLIDPLPRLRRTSTTE
jgi:hypothetical protein